MGSLDFPSDGRADAVSGVAARLPGFRHLAGYLDQPSQRALVDTVRTLADRAPFYRPVMPRSGRPLSVRMTNCGPLGWLTDIHGYRYQARHPETGDPWPPIPEALLALWADLVPQGPPPEACLLNLYEVGSKLGLHQDRDEQAMTVPVVSVSLGATAIFRIGGLKRSDPVTSIPLVSGDVVVLGGTARLAYHGIARVLKDTSPLAALSGRLNVTLRRVTP